MYIKHCIYNQYFDVYNILSQKVVQIEEQEQFLIHLTLASASILMRRIHLLSLFNRSVLILFSMGPSVF